MASKSVRESGTSKIYFLRKVTFKFVTGNHMLAMREQKLGVHFGNKRRKMLDLNLRHPHDIPAPNCLTTLPPPSLFDESQVNIYQAFLK